MNHDEIREIARLIKSEIQPEWMTESEVAVHLRVGRKWVRDHRAELGAALIPGTKQNIRYLRAAVDRVPVTPRMMPQTTRGEDE